jgi:hypothetical protein
MTRSTNEESNKEAIKAHHQNMVELREQNKQPPGSTAVEDEKHLKNILDAINLRQPDDKNLTLFPTESDLLEYMKKTNETSNIISVAKIGNLPTGPDSKHFQAINIRKKNGKTSFIAIEPTNIGGRGKIFVGAYAAQSYKRLVEENPDIQGVMIVSDVQKSGGDCLGHLDHLEARLPTLRKRQMSYEI